MNAQAAAGTAQATDILRSLEKDADLIQPRLRDWWVNYLGKHFDYYLDVLSSLDGVDRGAHILEVGSVPGQFTAMLKLLGFDVHGVDLDPSRVADFWQKYALPIEKVDIEQQALPFADGTFDVAIFAEVLEHLRINPLHALSEIRRVLKPGGRIILSTPNITPMDRVNFLLGRSYQGNPVKEFQKLEQIGHMGHIRLYSLDEIEGILKHVGFKVRGHTFKGKVMLRSFIDKVVGAVYPKKDQLRGFVFVSATKE